MAVTLPAELADLLAQTGHQWPDADEDQLLAMADGWRSLQDRLVTLRTDSSRPAQEIVAANESQAVAAFGDWGKEFDGYLLQLVEIYAQVEAILITVARAVLAAKKAIVDTLATLAKAIDDVKRSLSDIPLVGWLIGGAFENLIQEPLTNAIQGLTWIVNTLADLILSTIVPRLVELVRLVKGLVQGLRQLAKGRLGEDWPTNPSSDPDPAREPRGDPKFVNPDESPENQRALRLENQAAVTLAEAGYDIEQLPERKNQKNPDYRIEGQIFDGYAPTTDNVRNIWTYVQKQKVDRGQADRVVIILDDPDAQASVDAVRQQFQDYPIPGLREAKVIGPGGAIIDIYP
jgi:hypothetical protein